MKHTPIARPVAQPATPVAARAHTPDPAQCAGCEHREAACQMAFDQMPVLHVYTDGIAFVNCVQFDAAAVSTGAWHD
ncbi:hypothetical protein ACOI1H_16320 [Loktanella sp. DJP18]|uniref:hypothetical protein n=1 Tax=Loktanella sp. DJP18 TaxID=3409788 RepID=UPI003BB5CAAA